VPLYSLPINARLNLGMNAEWLCTFIKHLYPIVLLLLSVACSRPMIGYWLDTVVCPSPTPVRPSVFVCLSVCDQVYCGAQSRCRGWKWTVVILGGHFLSISSDTFAVGCIVQPQHTAKNRTAEISASRIAKGSVVAWPWLFQTRHFTRFVSAAMWYVVHSTISLLSDNYASC